jgi:hypothetical protein
LPSETFDRTATAGDAVPDGCAAGVGDMVLDGRTVGVGDVVLMVVLLVLVMVLWI